jgi:hypothetical protein
MTLPKNGVDSAGGVVAMLHRVRILSSPISIPINDIGLPRKAEASIVGSPQAAALTCTLDANVPHSIAIATATDTIFTFIFFISCCLLLVAFTHYELHKCCY